jgi:hypothetical protein
LDSKICVMHILKNGKLTEAWREDAQAVQPELF